MSSFGGIENLYIHYPHLQLSLMHTAHMETFWIVLSPHALNKPKQASRRAIEMLCHASTLKHNFYNPCPTSLTLSVWDIGSWSTRLTSVRDNITSDEVRERDTILRQILSFNISDGVKEIEGAHYKSSEMYLCVSTRSSCS